MCMFLCIYQSVRFAEQYQQNGKSQLLLALVLCGNVDYHGFQIDKVSQGRPKFMLRRLAFVRLCRMKLSARGFLTVPLTINKTRICIVHFTHSEFVRNGFL